MIEVDRLTRYYGDNPAVCDVSFVAARGEILGFLGPNGAGKTTTMRMLTCFLPPTRGTARIAGFDVVEHSLEVRKRIGYLPENVPLYRDLTVAGYLDHMACLRGMRRPDRVRAIARVLDECGIADVQRRPIGRLSRGYRQRVGLAQALVHDPEVLVLDEPTVGLDPRQIIEIRDLIRGLAGQRTVILSTHILPEVSLLCQRVLIIHRGRIVGDDAPERLATALRTTSTVSGVVRGSSETTSAVARALPGVLEVTARDRGDGTVEFSVTTAAKTQISEALSAALVGAGLGLQSLRNADPTLEDIFIAIIAGEKNSDA